MPLSYIQDLLKRMQIFKEGFNPKSKQYYFIEQIYPNIKAIIIAYKADKITNKGIFYFIGGKIVTKSEVKSHKKLL